MDDGFLTAGIPVRASLYREFREVSRPLPIAFFQNEPAGINALAKAKIRNRTTPREFKPEA